MTKTVRGQLNEGKSLTSTLLCVLQASFYINKVEELFHGSVNVRCPLKLLPKEGLKLA